HRGEETPPPQHRGEQGARAAAAAGLTPAVGGLGVLLGFPLEFLGGRAHGGVAQQVLVLLAAQALEVAVLEGLPRVLGERALLQRFPQGIAGDGAGRAGVFLHVGQDGQVVRVREPHPPRVRLRLGLRGALGRGPRLRLQGLVGRRGRAQPVGLQLKPLVALHAVQDVLRGDEVARGLGQRLPGLGQQHGPGLLHPAQGAAAVQDERREPALRRTGTHVEGHGAAVLPHEQSRGMSGPVGVFPRIHGLRHS
uniref:Lysyl-tRNA synthetase 1 n=1 Tax=Equus caballus TaxID=9796 RepID=A0A9L0R4V5_HORSE